MKKHTVSFLATIFLTVSALSYAEVDSGLQQECLSKKKNRNLLSCTKIAVNLAQESGDYKQAKKFFDLACPLDSKEYEPIACGIIGIDSMPELQTVVDGQPVQFTGGNKMYQSDLKKAKVYLERSCRAGKESHCIAYKAAAQK